MNPIKCLNKNVILMLPKADEKSEGGIFLPDQVKDDTGMHMEVFMAAADVTMVKRGDIVLKPDVRVISGRRGVDYDLKVTDRNGESRKAIVVEENDIRVVMRSCGSSLPLGTVSDD